MPLDLDASERALLIDLITGAIESEVFPMSARAQRLRSILGKAAGRYGTTETRHAGQWRRSRLLRNAVAVNLV